jgi:hypothetical protein
MKKRMTDQKWMIATFFLAALVGAVALADQTLQGKPNPYGRGVTVTVPSGTFPSLASPSTTGTMSHTGDAGFAGNVNIDKMLRVASDAGVVGNLGVTGDLLAAGGITVGGGSEVTAIRRGTASLWAGDAGVAEGACEAAQTITVTGVNASAQCLLGKVEALIAAGYFCQSYYSSPNTVGVKCCCVGAANCAYVAPATAGVVCFDP